MSQPIDFATDVQTLLEQGADVLLNSNLFMTLKGSQPSSTPTTPYITVVFTGGSGPDFVQNKAFPAARHPSAQVSAQARTSDEAYALIQLAYNALVISNRRVNDAHYRSIRPLQEPFEQQAADRNLAKWTFNIIAEVRS